MARKKKGIQETLPVKGEVTKTKKRKSKGIPLKEVKQTTTKRKSKGIPLKEVKKETIPVKGEVNKKAESVYYRGTPIPVKLKSGEKGHVYWIRGSPRVIVKGKGFQPISEIAEIRGRKVPQEGIIPMEELLERELLRTPKQRYMDEAHTSSKVLPPNSPEDIKWWLHPEKYDIKGVDTKGSHPFKEEEELNPNFVRRYPFIEKVQERTLYPTSKGKREHKGIPLKEVKKETIPVKGEKKTLPIKGEVTKTKKRKSKGIPLKEVKQTTTKRKSKGIPLKEVKKETLPVKGEVTKTKKRKTKGIPLKEVKKETIPVKGKSKIKIGEFSLKELNKMADQINTKIDTHIVCRPSNTGNGYICIDDTSKLAYTPKEVKTLYDTLFGR